MSFQDRVPSLHNSSIPQALDASLFWGAVLRVYFIAGPVGAMVVQRLLTDPASGFWPTVMTLPYGAAVVFGLGAVLGMPVTLVGYVGYRWLVGRQKARASWAGLLALLVSGFISVWLWFVGLGGRDSHGNEVDNIIISLYMASSVVAALYVYWSDQAGARRLRQRPKTAPESNFRNHTFRP